MTLTTAWHGLPYIQSEADVWKRLLIRCKWQLLRRPVERAVWGDSWGKVTCPGTVTALLVPCLGDPLWHQLSTDGTNPDTKPGWQQHTVSALLRIPSYLSYFQNCHVSVRKQISLVQREFWVKQCLQTLQARSFVSFLQFGVFVLCLLVAVGKSWYAMPDSEGKMDVSNWDSS